MNFTLIICTIIKLYKIKKGIENPITFLKNVSFFLFLKLI